jgi:NADH-quinone oxidoreductase subunit C
MNNTNLIHYYELQEQQLKKILKPFITVTYPSYSDILIQTHQNYLITLLNFLKNDSMYQFKHLIDIVAVDQPGKNYRFTLIYCLLSTTFNQRIQVSIQTNELKSIESVTSIYKNANWSEREIWDLYGIKFLNHPDLRRILTDYGFEGFPFRKDFPLSGYKEVTYSDTLKSIKYDKIELTQAYRNFKYFNPWVSNSTHIE